MDGSKTGRKVGWFSCGAASAIACALAKPDVVCYSHANCIPCSKAQSPNYWSLVRKVNPREFHRAAKLSRRLGARLTRIKGERIFIDEIPADWPVSEAEAPACDMLCQLAESSM